MSLLQNEDFLIWQLRASYLTNIKDGIGERLINVDSGILNDPSFRAGGWVADDIAELKRTHSPPIPTTIASDYFYGPPRSAGLAPPNFNDEEEEGGMITGRGSNDTVGPGRDLKRRRRREQQEEDDSSDLSDESEEDVEGTHRAAQQIKFAKMPLRNRSGSSPIPESNLEDDLKEGSESHLPSFAKPFGHTRLRGDSFGAVEAIKQRARRDTTTSSDMSSESEFNSSTFKRKQIPLGKSTNLTNLLQKKFKEDEMLRPSNLSETINEDSPNESDASSLSSGFAETADPGSLLEDIRDPLPSSLTNMKPTISLNLDSPRKSNHTPSTLLQALPPPRPISTVQPISLLGQAIKARNSKPKNPLESFAKLSGKGALDPLYIRIYVPLSNFPTKSFEMPLLRMRPDATGADKSQVTVAEAIGLSLWRYHEEGLEPSIEGTRLNVNRWTLRIFDDGEVDFDFPALSRTKPIVDFTLNNNRGVRARLRERPYDEFALVEATDDQFLENQSLTPMYNQQMESGPSTLPPELKATTGPSMSRIYTHSNLKSGPQLADNPVVPVSHSTPRIGPPKSLRISFTNLEALTQITTIEVTTDTYIAEVLDTVCKRWKLDKADHILKVSGTNTVAPVDRTVEAMGAYADLILVRRRFATEGAIGFAGSPGSSSPNAPLLLTAGTPTKKSKRMIQPMQQPIFKQDLLGNLARYKRYIVLRKQPMSFTSAHQRLLLMDDDYMHILPGDNGRTLFDSSAKTSRIPFSMIVGCKVSRRHPKTFRVIIFRERESKRYDFEAQSIADAAEIVAEIRKGMEPFHPQTQGIT